jgi:hypothetical protein
MMNVHATAREPHLGALQHRVPRHARAWSDGGCIWRISHSRTHDCNWLRLSYTSHEWPNPPDGHPHHRSPPPPAAPPPPPTIARGQAAPGAAGVRLPPRRHHRRGCQPPRCLPPPCPPPPPPPPRHNPQRPPQTCHDEGVCIMRTESRISEIAGGSQSLAILVSLIRGTSGGTAGPQCPCHGPRSDAPHDAAPSLPAPAPPPSAARRRGGGPAWAEGQAAAMITHRR